MAGDHARILLAIWADDDWRDLTPAAQHLYLLLLTHPDRSFAGTVDWRPKRLRALATGWGADAFDRAAHELAHHLYIVVDEDTEEVLIRSFVRHDGLLKSPNMGVAMVKDFKSIASRGIRGVFIHELLRLREDVPDLKGWTAAEEILDNRSIDPSEYPTGYPSADPSGNPSVNPSPNPSEKGLPNPSGNPSPTPLLLNSKLPTPSSLLPSPAPHADHDPQDDQPPALIHDDGTPTPAGIVREWERAAGVVQSDSTRAGMRIAVSQCQRAGHDPQTIAQGLADWAGSKMTHPNQIPSFVDRAAVRPRLAPAHAPAKKHNADEWLELGERMAAERGR